MDEVQGRGSLPLDDVKKKRDIKQSGGSKKPRGGVLRTFVGGQATICREGGIRNSTG